MGDSNCDETKSIPPQINGDDMLHLHLDMCIDFKNYERVKKMWGEEIVLVRRIGYTCKLMVVNGGWTCSTHHHQMKDETFVCLSGCGTVYLNGVAISVMAGDKVEVPNNTPHSFRSATGMVLMEVSTFDDPDDNVRTQLSRKI